MSDRTRDKVSVDTARLPLLLGGVAQGSGRVSGWNSNGDTVLRVKQEEGHPGKIRMLSGCGLRRGHRPAACERRQLG